MATDLDRKRKTDARFVDFLQDLDIAYVVTDSDGYTIESNTADQRMTGYTFDELRAMPRSSLYSSAGDRDV